MTKIIYQRRYNCSILKVSYQCAVIQYLSIYFTGLFGSGSPGPAHGLRLSSSGFPPK